MKYNRDGAFYDLYENQRKGAARASIRDEFGGFVRGSDTEWYDHGLHALTMEAFACRDGLVLAKQVRAIKFSYTSVIDGGRA